MSEDRHFGYETSLNQQLMDSRRLARRMGEDIAHYAPIESGDYIEPTINWENPRLTQEQEENRNQLFMADSIERIYKRVMAQNSNAVRQLALQWNRVGMVLDDIRTRLYNASVDLKNGGDGGEGWTGKGAEAFLARGPGATIKSLDDWYDAALVNATGGYALASVIDSYQARLNTLYEKYKSDMVTYAREYLTYNFGDPNIDVETLPGNAKDDYVEALRGEQIQYSKQAQAIAYQMASEYWSVLSEELRGGSATVYEGPTDAVQENPQFIAEQKYGVPNLNTPVPNIGQPNITKPNVSVPNVTKPTVTPNLTPPRIAPPNVIKPEVTVPTVTPPSFHITAVPPVPPAMPPGLVTGGPPVTGTPAAVRTQPGLSANNLLNNLPGQGKSVPGVLRPGAGPTATSAGSQPSMPSMPGGGKPPPGAKIRGPGATSNTGGPPGAPATPRGGKGTPGQNVPGQNVPGRGVPGGPNQFGGPPGSPSSPVLRAPRTDQPSSSGLPGRGAPAMPGCGGRPGTPGSASPVLGRPRGSAPVELPPAAPTAPRTGGDPALSPPPPPTSRPVVGRPAAPTTDGRLAETSSSVLRGSRPGSSGYEGQIGSRKRVEEETQLSVDQEFDKLQQLLHKEEAWTVATPGGGVLDSAPSRHVTGATEPKPTLGA